MTVVPPVLHFTWPRHAIEGEVQTRAEFDLHLATGSLRGLTVQGVRLDDRAPDLTGVDVTDALFVGCRFDGTAAAADVVARGGSVVPVFEGVPYPSSPATLYTPEDLAAGFQPVKRLETDGGLA